MDQDYTKRELDTHFKELGDKIEENTALTKSLDLKVGIQNGRVSRLESRWLGVTIAGGACVFLMGIIISLVVYSFNTSLGKLKSDILLEIKN